MAVIRVTDSDQNLDPGIIDTVTVDLADGTDTELLRLYETAPNSGIFLGYVYTSGGGAPGYDGTLIAPAGTNFSVSYNDGGPIVTQSAAVVAAGGGRTLWLQLSSDEDLVAISDIFSYTLKIENLDSITAPSVTIEQELPAGFRYLKGSLTVNGNAAANPKISRDGGTLTIPVGDLAAGATATASFKVRVGAVSTGLYPSLATAGTTNGAFSNQAKASVTVRDELGNDKSFIAGRVLAGCDDSEGVEGVRIYLEDGTYVITDERGRYHVEGVNPGTHVLQLDPITLPDGFEPSLCEDHTRFADNPSSRFVELRPGHLWRADFYIADTPLDGEVTIALNNDYAVGAAATYSISMTGRDVSLSQLKLKVTLPTEAEYLPGSAALDDAALDDPQIDGKTLVFNLPDKSDTWQSSVRFRALIDQESETTELPAAAQLFFDTPAESNLSTPTAESQLVWISRGERAEIRELMLRPHFETLDAELSRADLESLAGTIEQLKQLNLIKVYVIGHTDARRISWHDGVPFKNNFELSQARATAVSRKLLEQLDLEAEQVVTVGMAAALPMTDDASPEGLAQNRRTELQVLHRVVIDPEMDKIDVVNSDPQAIATKGTSRLDHTDKKKELKTGLLAPNPEQTLPHSIEAVKVRIDSSLTPKLTLDGVEIPAEQIGFTMQDPESGTTLMTYIGIDFGAPGHHTLKIEGIGPFGNSRFTDEIEIIHTGAINRIEVIESSGNVADSRTPIEIQLKLTDQAGEIISGGAKLEVRQGKLVPTDDGKKELHSASDANLVKVDRNGIARFEPVTQAGSYHIVLGYDEVEIETDIYVSPEKRDWILVGLGEGTAGDNDITGHIEPLDPNAPEEDFYYDGRLAFFAKGQVKGDWLLTVAYDSDKEDLKDKSLKQVIDPDSYYTVYGDNTEQGYEASSAENLFIRIERERFYSVFGDIDTGLSTTELSRYNRSLTGIKSEWQNNNFGYTAFASETAQKFVRDEIQGDGTSGLYRLSSSDIVINSEKIVLETRNRFHSEQIVDTQELQRHLDYDIDYDAGTLFFKEPVLSRDPDMNPTFIVVDYEATSTDKEDYTYGGRAYTRIGTDKVVIGASAVHEGQDAVESDLYGVDAEVKLGDKTTVKAEWATSEAKTVTADTDGDAWLAKFDHRNDRFDINAYMREQDGSFGLGQQNASEAGTRKLGTDVTYRLNDAFDIAAGMSQQENLATGLKRQVEEGSVKYNAERYSLTAGLRHAEDDPATGPTETSDQLTFGAEYHATEKLDLTLRHEQSLSDNENRDYPTRTLVGARYKLNRAVSLFAEQEVTNGDSADTADTRVGLNATPWDGTQIRTSMEQNVAEAGRRVFGNLGLTQSWQINPKLSIDFSLDRSQVLSGQNTSSLQSDQPPASGSSEDFSAFSTGLSYREINWTFDTRAEYRTSDSEDKWGLFAGSIVEPTRFIGLSLKGNYYTTDRADQSSSDDADLSFGIAYRPDNRRWIVLNRLDLVTSEEKSSTSVVRDWKVVERMNAFWRAGRKDRLTFKLGTRYSSDEYDTEKYDGLAGLVGAEWRHDISKRFDFGLHGSLLQVDDVSQSLTHSGVSVGYSPAKNFWISLGYNMTGFNDEDFSQADYTAQGPYLKFRFKFDQNSLRDALKWMGRN